MKKGIIYEWRNKLDGKFYVGQTVRPKRRYNEHVKAKGDSVFHRAIRLHGIENFEYTVVATYEHETPEGLYDLLNEAEKERIIFRNSLAPNGYNVTPGGENGNFLAGYTQEQYEEYCKKRSVIAKQCMNTEQVKENIRQSQLNRFNGENGEVEREKVSIATKIGMENYFQEYYDEFCENCRQAQLNRYYGENGEDEREKQRIIQLNRYNGENGEVERKKTSEATSKAYAEHPEYRDHSRQAQLNRYYGENGEAERKIVSDRTRDLRWVNNGIKEDRVHFAKVDKFLKTHKGWKRGRLHGTTTGTTCVNNGVINKYIPKTELNEYLANGWINKQLRKNAS